MDVDGYSRAAAHNSSWPSRPYRGHGTTAVTIERNAVGLSTEHRRHGYAPTVQELRGKNPALQSDVGRRVNTIPLSQTIQTAAQLRLPQQ